MPLFADIDDLKPSKIKVSTFEWKDTEILKAIPSSSWDKKRCVWLFNLTWQSCLALKAEFGEDLSVGPALTQWAQDEYTNKILPAYTLRDKVEGEGYERLFPHQRGDVLFLSTAERAILANGLGSGKSQSAFSTARYLWEFKQTNPFPALVVCPNSTKFSWKREIEEVWPGLNVVVIDGTAGERKKQFVNASGTVRCVIHDPEPVDESKPVKKSKAKPKAPVCTCKAHVYIINWESVRTHSRLKHYGDTALKKCTQHGGLDPKVTAAACEVHPKDLNEIDFNMVIGDEAHRIMDPSSKVSQAFKAATGDARFRIALTGTPISASPENLFSILNWLMPEAYPSKTKYVERFCKFHLDNWGTMVVTGIRRGMENEFFQGVDPFLRRMPKELILPFLPPVLRSRRDVEMTAKQKKAYEQMKEQMIAEVDEGVVTTTSALTKATRMLQFASSYAEVEYRMVKDPETKQMVEKPVVLLKDPSCKLDAFMEDLPGFGDDSIVVFAVSKQLINMLSARLNKAGIAHGLITGDQDAVERQHHMDAFQAGHTKLILVSIAAGGTGITLTKGRVGVFLQRSWSMIENTQAEGRIHRIGSQQHESVQIIDYVTAGSSEELVFKAVEEKGRQLEFILRDAQLMKKYLKAEDIDMSGQPTVQEDDAA